MQPMTGAEFMAAVRAYAAEHPDAFDGLQVLIDEAVEEGRIVPTSPEGAAALADLTEAAS